jgi:hypothetical protein
MRASPTRPSIKSLLVAFNALPTKEVFGIVRSNELNDVIGYSIATLATFDCLMFRHLGFFDNSI